MGPLSPKKDMAALAGQYLPLTDNCRSAFERTPYRGADAWRCVWPQRHVSNCGAAGERFIISLPLRDTARECLHPLSSWHRYADSTRGSGTLGHRPFSH